MAFIKGGVLSRIAEQTALSYEDVLLVPGFSEIVPTDVSVKTRLCDHIHLSVPVISSAMDTVTESKLAIAMAQAGGIGTIHKNMSITQQAEEIRKVKRFESGIVTDPVVIHPKASLKEAMHIMKQHHFSGIPVIDPDNDKLVGIITNRDVRFVDDDKAPVDSLMTKKIVTIAPNSSMEEAKKLLHQNRIEKLLVVDENMKCKGMITVKDIERAKQFPDATKDKDGRLLVAAAVGIGKDGFKRTEALIEAGCDIIVVDTAHGHSKGVLEQIKNIRKKFSSVCLIGGNVATGDGAKSLIDAGVDSVKIGIGPGSICTTRIVAGVGVPQFSAILEAAEICRDNKVTAIADGGIKSSGDIAKAIAAGADVVMIGSLFAGTDETPGDVFLFQGRSYKSYRGMGSVSAMARGSADRYFQQEVSKDKLVPEGVEGRVPYKGALANVIEQLVGGLRSAMGYTGNATIKNMQQNSKFVRITNAGLRESHVHDVIVTREAPNYRFNS